MEPPPTPPMLRFGPYLADFRSGELRKSGARIRLQEKPLRVLALLAERQGQLVTREELKKRLWPDDTFVDFETGLNTAVSKLRDALSDNAEKPRYIETIPRRGYRFVATVAQAETPPDGHTALSSVPPKDDGLRSAAVLPFENLSHDPTQDYFSDGMTEALITALSKMNKLRVISRTSVMQYQKARKPLPEIARELGVEFIVEGSVLQVGSRMRIAAQLIDGRRDQHIWAERYEEDFSGVLALLEQTAAAVASAVAGRVGFPTSTLASATRRIAPAAAQAYLKGRHQFYRFTEEGLLAAIECYEKAIEADPKFSLAYSAMAYAYCAMVTPVDALPPRTLFERAGAAARKAISIDDLNAEARWVLGLAELMFHWNWKAGERETHLALELEPNNPEAHNVMAVYHHLVGEFSDGVAECEEACLLDPFSPFTRTSLHFALYLARQNEKAIQLLHADRNWLSGFFKYHAALGVCAIQDQDWETAIAEFQRAVETSGGCSFVKARLAYALAASGRQRDARVIFQELHDRARSRYVSGMDFALVAIALCEIDVALDWLDKAYEERATHLIHIVSDPLFDPLRKTTRFRDLVHRIGIPNVLGQTPAQTKTQKEN